MRISHRKGNPVTSNDLHPDPVVAPAWRSPGEFAAAKAFLGDLRGRAVLDFGCAEPKVVSHAVASGAHYVGCAADEGIRAAATEVAGGGEIQTRDLDRWSGHDAGQFDVVVSVGALLYVRNLARLLETWHHHVVPGGRLVFTVDHPFVTGGGDGTHYFREGARPEYPRWAGRTAYHRTFESYVRELRYCGFQLLELTEGEAPRWTVFRCVRTP